MEIVAFLAPWILVGIGVLFVAFSGGPGAAREAYLTRGRTAFWILIPLVYIGLGVAIPAVVIADRGAREGATDRLAAKKERDAADAIQRGKELFTGACAQCHDLDAVNARGIAGPDLDEIGALTPERVVGAIERGGTGQGRMPAELLVGDNARAVARYLADVAGE